VPNPPPVGTTVPPAPPVGPIAPITTTLTAPPPVVLAPVVAPVQGLVCDLQDTLGGLLGGLLGLAPSPPPGCETPDPQDDPTTRHPHR
jgi:hypothetical protein